MNTVKFGKKYNEYDVDELSAPEALLANIMVAGAGGLALNLERKRLQSGVLFDKVELIDKSLAQMLGTNTLDFVSSLQLSIDDTREQIALEQQQNGGTSLTALVSLLNDNINDLLQLNAAAEDH